MPADASIYSLIQPVRQPDLMQQVGGAMQLKQLMQQGQLADLQRGELERGIAEEAQLRDLFRRGTTPTAQEIYAVSPKRGAEYQKTLLEQQKAESDIAKSKADALKTNTQTLRDMTARASTDADMAIIKDTAFRLFGPQVAANIPTTFSPEWQQKQILDADKLLERMRPNRQAINAGGKTVITEMNPNAPGYTGADIPHTATPGDVLSDRRGWATINKPIWDSDRGVFVNPPQMGGQGATGTNMVTGVTGAPAAPAAPAPAAAPAPFVKPANLPPKGGDVMALRKEFNDLPEVKNYRSVIPILNSAANAPDNKAGDIQFAYTIGKIFDPNSVVREGELKLVGEAANVFQKYMGELQALTQGKGRLTPQTRYELLAAAHARANDLKAAHDAAQATYERNADAQGLPKDQIFVKPPRLTPLSKPTTGQGTRATQGGIKFLGFE